MGENEMILKQLAQVPFYVNSGYAAWYCVRYNAYPSAI
jgi:hypothetical protein